MTAKTVKKGQFTGVVRIPRRAGALGAPAYKRRRRGSAIGGALGARPVRENGPPGGPKNAGEGGLR